MKKLLIVLSITLVTTICSHAQENNYLKEKSEILIAQVENLKELQKLAYIIDSDSESNWAYGEADKLLKSISLSGNNYYHDLAKVYSVYTYIYYGMSYTRSIMAMSRGDEYSLSELNSTIIKDVELNELDLRILTEYELAAIYSAINFYKVSRMPKYSDMNKRYESISSRNVRMFEEFSDDLVYKIMSFDIKVLYYMTFVTLVNDLYLANHPEVTQLEYDKFISKIIKLGNRMDEIPSEVEEIFKLSVKEYYEYMLEASIVQNEILGLLVQEMKELGGIAE